ncbi:MAG: calcium-binding protein, partial [Cyanobacteria bacterium J06576_12]
IRVSPLRTNNDTVNDELDDLMRDIYQVSYGLHDLELERLNRSTSAPPVFSIGNDEITGGSDADWIVGDDQFFFGPFLTSAEEESTSALVKELRAALGSFEQSLYRQIDAFDPATATQSKVPGRLMIGNDTLKGLGGDDRVIGDDQYLFAPVLESVPYRRRSFWNYGRGQDETGRSQDLQDFDLTLSNDTVEGNEGKDMIVGDYATTLLPVFESLPGDRRSQERLGTAMDGLISDIEQLLRDLHQEDYGIRFAQRSHTHDLNALNDTLSGNAGDDLIVGDNASLRLPIVGGKPELSLRLTSDRFNVEDEAYNFSHGLPRQVELAFRLPDDKKEINKDTITGNAGADILFGSAGKDNLSGGSEDDFLVGGRGDDNIDPGTGTDTTRLTNLNPTDLRRLLNPAIDAQLETWLSPASKNYLDELILNRSRFSFRDDIDGQSAF